MPAPSLIQRRIEELRKIDSLLSDLRIHLAGVSPSYRADVAFDLRAIADELDSVQQSITFHSPPATYQPGGDEGEAEDGDQEDAKPDPSVAKQIRTFFLGRLNQPASINDICSAAGLNLQSVKSLLYKRNRGRFVQVQARGGGGLPGLWRLSDTFHTHGQLGVDLERFEGMNGHPDTAGGVEESRMKN